MKNNDDLSKIVDALKAREEILVNDGSNKKYNQKFDIMRKYARKLIDKNRQDELLPYLKYDSVSIQRDVAGLLFHCYPDICRKVLQDIGNMTIETGLSRCFINISISANMALEIGIPKDFP